VFTARYELSSYITQIYFVLKGINLSGTFMLPTITFCGSRIYHQSDGITRRKSLRFLKKTKLFTYTCIGGSIDGPVGKVTSLRFGRPWNRGTILGSGRNFQFSKWPRPKLGTTQAPIQWKSEGPFVSADRSTRHIDNQPNQS
jgi:hypothetical protein